MTSSRASVAFILLLIGTSLWAADRNVSIASVAVGAGKPWQWTVFIKGTPDVLAHIKCVQYALDSSFPNPSRTICDRGTEERPFSSNGTTWGPFKLSATVTFDDGTVQQYQYSFPQAGIYQNTKWHPTDMTFNPASGLFILDKNAGIFRVSSNASGIQLDTLQLKIPSAYQPQALAASKDFLFVSSNGPIGCMIFRYSFADGVTNPKVLAKVECDGIATDGAGVFLVDLGGKEVRYWSSFDSSSYKTWGLPVLQTDSVSGPLNFDYTCHCLIFANRSGTAYTLSLPNGKWSTLTYNLGYVQSIASDSSRILFASGKNILFYSTTNNRRENAPTSMQPLTGGLITGVVIDSSGSAWIADFDKGIVKGPIPLD
jgi:YEATS family